MHRKHPSGTAAASRKTSLARKWGSQEIGGLKKKWTNRLPVGLIYPNTYSVGMSNLGFQLVYGLLNSDPHIVAERIFLPAEGNQPKSIESDRLVTDFPVLLCSVSFEQDYLNLIKILHLSGIQPLAAKRTSSGSKGSAAVASVASGGQPLVIAGGVATFINPEPLAPIIDLFIIGEAEPVLPEIMTLLVRLLVDKGKKTLARDELLRELATRFPYCYVPQFYNFTYGPAGELLSIQAAFPGLPNRIKRAVLHRPEAAAGHSLLLTPDTEFANLYMTELGRGCSRGCRFCAAGFVYRPPRLWPPDTIVSGLGERPPTCQRIGLLGMEMLRAEDLGLITEYLLNESCSLSFSSLRADAIGPQLTELLAKSATRTSAIAPDGGSERLRRVINKSITENDLLSAAESLIQAGIRNLKLYFMIGLPTETLEDLEELIALTLKIKKKMLSVGRTTGKIGRIALSVNCFVPKPWTPFQFHPFEEVLSLKKKIKHIRARLSGESNIKITAERPEKVFFQAVIARGDRKVGNALSLAVQTARGWREVFNRLKLPPENYATRRREQNELFPWEILDHGIDRNFLWTEYQKALKGKMTSPCDTSSCKRCGVCNGKQTP